PSLYEYAIAGHEATIVEGGALCAQTGHHTGRSPKDKHTVVDDLTRDSVWWDGNRKMSKENFDNLLADFQKHAEGKKLFAQDLYGGPIRNTASRPACSPNWPGILCSFVNCCCALRAPSWRASSPTSPSSTCRRSSRTPSVTVAATVPTPWWRSISPARSC